jgi:hypothetical protein
MPTEAQQLTLDLTRQSKAVPELDTSWRTWRCEGKRLLQTNIDRAIAAFRDVTGQEPCLIALHPKNEVLAPEGLELRIIGGCLANEVWLAAGVPQTVRRGIFNSDRDKEVIDAGGFFCQACSVGKPASEKSPDLKYCQDCCYGVIEDEKHKPRGESWYWSDCGQVQFIDGRGYGIDVTGRTLDIGREADILKAFATGEIASDLCLDRAKILKGILKYRKELTDGDTKHRTGKASLERGRFTRPLRADTAAARPPPAHARFPLRVFKRTT